MTRSPKNFGHIAGRVAAAAVIVAGGILIQRWRKMPIASKRINLLDVPIDPLTMPDALARMEDFIRSGQPHHVFTADASGIMRAHEDPEMLKIVKQADLITADGAGVMLATRMHGVSLPERVSGVDLVEHLCALAAEHGYSVYFFGAAEGIAQTAAKVLHSRYPGLTVAGTRNGFFTPEEETTVVQQIAQAKPDILFVALGIPKQEKFIRQHFQELMVPVMVGIGGSFDVISGRLQRAPRWMQRLGLEWLYRFAQEPARLPRLMALPNFILAAWRARKR